MECIAFVVLLVYNGRPRSSLWSALRLLYSWSTMSRPRSSLSALRLLYSWSTMSRLGLRCGMEYVRLLYCWSTMSRPRCQCHATPPLHCDCLFVVCFCILLLLVYSLSSRLAST